MRRSKGFNAVEVTGTAARGMELVLTKWIALSGTVSLIRANENKIHEVLPEGIIERALLFSKDLSVSRDVEVASELGVASFCKAGTGGIYHALWDIADASGVGIEVDLSRIPIRQETIEICEVLDVDPYKLESRGAVLMACSDPKAVCEAFFSAGIHASVIGRVTDGIDRVIITGGTKRFLSPRSY